VRLCLFLFLTSTLRGWRPPGRSEAIAARMPSINVWMRASSIGRLLFAKTSRSRLDLVVDLEEQQLGHLHAVIAGTVVANFAFT